MSELAPKKFKDGKFDGILNLFLFQLFQQFIDAKGSPRSIRSAGGYKTSTQTLKLGEKSKCTGAVLSAIAEENRYEIILMRVFEPNSLNFSFI